MAPPFRRDGDPLHCAARSGRRLRRELSRPFGQCISTDRDSGSLSSSVTSSPICACGDGAKIDRRQVHADPPDHRSRLAMNERDRRGWRKIAGIHQHIRSAPVRCACPGGLPGLAISDTDATTDLPDSNQRRSPFHHGPQRPADRRLAVGSIHKARCPDGPFPTAKPAERRLPRNWPHAASPCRETTRQTDRCTAGSTQIGRACGCCAVHQHWKSECRYPPAEERARNQSCAGVLRVAPAQCRRGSCRYRPSPAPPAACRRPGRCERHLRRPKCCRA